MKALIITTLLLVLNVSFANIEDGGEPETIRISRVDNSNNNYFVISLERISYAGVNIYDEFDCLVFSRVIDKEKTILNLEHLANGLYNVEIQNDGNVYESELKLD